MNVKEILQDLCANFIRYCIKTNELTASFDGVNWFLVEDFPKNKLITIGYLGQKQCYLNITEDEAIKRYCQSEGMSIEEFNKNGIKINIIEFQDEFWAYDVSD